MALISCPECGKSVSDKAVACPHCAYPISNSHSSGICRIKLGETSEVKKSLVRRKVTISSNGIVIFEGHSGDIAEIFVDKRRPIHIKYHMHLSAYGGECEGLLDYSSGRSYVVNARIGFLKTNITLQRVDYIDA